MKSKRAIVVQGIMSTLASLLLAIFILANSHNSVGGFILGNLLIIWAGFVAGNTRLTYKRLQRQERIAALLGNLLRQQPAATTPLKGCGDA